MNFLIFMIMFFKLNLNFGLDTANNRETTPVVSSASTASNRLKKDSKSFIFFVLILSKL